MAGKPGQIDALILSLAAGRTHAQAAREAGCSARTVRRRLQAAEFRRRVTEARGEMVGRAVGMLAAASTEAVVTLRHLLTGESESVRLGAARSLLELGPKLRESTELIERIELLERKLNGQHSRTHPPVGSRNGQPAV